MKTPITLLGLIATDLVLAGLALLGGISLMLDPSGASIGMDPYLSSIPLVTDFMPAAIWLLVVFAALPLILVYGMLTQRRWALYGSFALVALELVWMSAQLYLLYSFGFILWHIAIVVLAFVSLALVLMPSIRTYFQKPTVAATMQAGK